MGNRTAYSIAGYGEMIMDGPRMEAYSQALQKAVRQGCTVLDVGCGTGIFSLLACRFGAGHVYAIDPGDAIEVARAIAADNGCKDRITFYQKLSTAVMLEKKADVMVSDLRGILPLFQSHIPSIVDARQRLLILGSTLIPRKDTLWAALVSAPDQYKSCLEPWQRNDFDLDMQAGRPFVINSFRKVNLKAEQLLVQPRCWGTLDYATVHDPNIRCELNWKIEHEAAAHGFVAWFDTILGEGIGFSNAPGQPKLIYGQAFFPWVEPVKLQQGDSVSMHIQAALVGDDYSWKWDTRIVNGHDPQAVKAEFTQSTFYGKPLSAANLRKKASNFAPDLEDRGKVDLFILNQMDGSSTVEEIAIKVKESFPDIFKDWRDALTRVGELSQKYSR
jgi:protein arginine N-methyltransferase 1